jgi:uncharacterized protein
METIDVHVHLHPPRIAQAIERYFVEHQGGWVNAHPFDPDQVAATLAKAGVTRYCVFSYAHKPGIARSINAWLASTAAGLPGAIPLGTVHAGDPELEAVVDEALAAGHAGFKLHLSVQRFAADAPALDPFYARLEQEQRLLIVHAGTAPYRDRFTGVEGFTAVMRRFPRLRACVAHLGTFEHEAFLAMTEAFPHLYVDTAMALAPAAAPWIGGDGRAIPDALLLRHQDRILFGSDFPLIPYEYEEERRWADDRGLPEDVRRKIFHDNALRFLGPALRT